MFIKLIKHDFKFSYKIFFGMFAGLIALMVIMRVTNLSPNQGYLPVETLRGIISLLGIVGVAIASYFQILMFFHRNFFGAEGYLMLTLPLSRGKILASKFIVAQVWFNFMMLLVPIMTVIIAPPMGGGSLWDAFIRALSPQLFLIILYMNLIALVLIAFLFLTVTLANTVIFGKKIHALIAGIFAAVVHFLFFWGISAMVNRFYETVNMSWTHPDGWSSVVGPLIMPQTGFAYGRLAPESWQNPYTFGIIYIDIWLVGYFLIIAAAAMALTMHLLKKRVALR